MFQKRFISIGLLFGCLSFLLPVHSKAFADDAKVLPKHVWRVQLISTMSYIEDKFDSSGTSVSLGSGYSQTINAQFLAALKPQAQNLVKSLNQVSPGLGDHLDIADLGMNIETNIMANRFVMEYGLTDRLSVGVILPVVHAEVSVKANSSTTDQFNQTLNSVPAPYRSALLAMQSATTVAALNQTLQNDLGYDSGLNSWSGSGIGDLELGAKYNYYRSFPFQLTAKTGVRVPTGRTDDPNNLFDVGFGDGQFDVGIFNYADYQALSNLYFTWETGYTAQLPHSTIFRVPVINGVQISGVKAKLDQDLGDIVETGLEANLAFLKTMYGSVKYHFWHKFSDSYSGEPSGVPTSAMEANTAETLHEGIFRIGLSTLPLRKSDRNVVPLDVSLFYNLPIAGENIAQVQTAGLQLKSYF